VSRHTLDDALVAGRADLDELARLRDRYPSAEQVRLPDGRLAWANSTIDPTGFLICVVTDEEDVRDLGDVWLCPYEEIGATFVFALKPAWARAARFFERISERDPETFHKLLETFGK